MDQALIKKRIDFKFSKQELQFDVEQSLFSSYGIDNGTKALLNSLRKNETIDYKKVLDLGCGYGPLGIFIKKTKPEAKVLCTDRDALALEFTKHNASLNKVEVTTQAALGYCGVKGKFSLICTNFPAKLQRQGLESFVYGASSRLTKNGILAIVIVNELDQDMQEIIIDEDITVVFEGKTKHYKIYHLTFSKVFTEPEDPYFRLMVKLPLEKPYKNKTVFGIGEFDQLNHGTMAAELLLEELSPQHKVALIEPGQGHLAIMLHDYWNAEVIVYSRDLLSLQVTEHNMKEAGATISTKHQAELDVKEKIIVWNLTDKEQMHWNHAQAQRILKKGQKILAFGKKRYILDVLGPQKVLAEECEEKSTALFVEVR
jgi:16S rRNA G1207 methylase RsmC